ncbi:MAG: hypothetical protein ACUVT7_06135 [Thermoplasmata archaeon]
MPRWRVNLEFAIWGVGFGIVATVTGLLLLSAVTGGFLAEGFFLLVIFWVLLMVMLAKIVSRIRKGRQEKEFP